MSKKGNTGKPASANDVVELDRMRDKLKVRRQDEQAAALAAQFHSAMGWKGTPDTPVGKKAGRRKKRK